MRVRALLVVVGVLVGLLAVVGIASGQSGNESELGLLIKAFRDAEVNGDNVVVSEPVPDNPILNPFGGDSEQPMDITGPIRAVQSLQVQVNPGSPYQYFEQDPMGVPGLFYDPANPGFDMSPGAFEFPMPQQWVPPSYPSPLDFEEFLARMLGLPGVPTGFSGQWSAGQGFPVDGAFVIPPAGGATPPMNIPWIIRGVRFAEPMPDGFCDGKILEFFTADAIPGQPLWVPADFAPNDVFGGASTAFATRCIDGTWQPTQMLVNNGQNFQPQGTFATGIVYPDAFFQIIPVTDAPATMGWRIGAFATDAGNPFQPSNSGFSTLPPYPELAPGTRPPVYMASPMPGAPVFPVALDFTGLTDGSPDYTNNFGFVIDDEPPSDDIHEFKVDLLQYDTWQISSGVLRFDPDTEMFEGMLEGSGDGYTEMYAFGPDTYTHEADEVQEFSFSFNSASDLMPVFGYLTDVVLDREAAVAETTTTTEAPATTITSPGDDPVDVPEEGSSTEGGFSPFLWLILIGIALIVAGFLLWLLFGRKKPDPCADLYAAWQKAKAACDEATADATKKRAEADAATTARESADKAVDDHCAKYPPACGPEASASSGGRTVTRDDLWVNRAWNAAAWKKYKDGGTAQDTQDDWNNGPDDEFRDAAQKELDAAKAKTPSLKKAADDAKKAESDAKTAADNAEAAAKKACDAAAAAKQAYDDCVGAASAGAAAADAAATGAAAGAVGGMAGAVAGAAAQAGGGKNCEPQQQAYDAAKKACDDAMAASKSADRAVADAHTALDDAEAAIEQLCAEYPPLCGEDAWIEESGKPETRIDRSDLFVQDMWSESVWADYQTDQIDAQEVQDRWNSGPSDEFARDAKQKLKDAAPLKPVREQAIRDARTNLSEAEKAAKEARRKAEEACAKADAAKKALDACLQA